MHSAPTVSVTTCTDYSYSVSRVKFGAQKSPGAIYIIPTDTTSRSFSCIYLPSTLGRGSPTVLSWQVGDLRELVIYWRSKVVAQGAKGSSAVPGTGINHQPVVFPLEVKVTQPIRGVWRASRCHSSGSNNKLCC